MLDNIYKIGYQTFGYIFTYNLFVLTIPKCKMEYNIKVHAAWSILVCPAKNQTIKPQIKNK